MSLYSILTKFDHQNNKVLSKAIIKVPIPRVDSAVSSQGGEGRAKLCILYKCSVRSILHNFIPYYNHQLITLGKDGSLNSIRKSSIEVIFNFNLMKLC